MPGDISYRSTACELLKENQQGGNKLPPSPLSHPLRLGLSSNCAH